MSNLFSKVVKLILCYEKLKRRPNDCIVFVIVTLWTITLCVVKKTDLINFVIVELYIIVI